ncbi:MAG TPA: Gldg family protein [Flavobacteriales bacterium]|nr:Gldg family protein [Flavobacteriales bacterium]HRP80856.1 Gldg family protein [Flavobacteriales bacterium]
MTKRASAILVPALLLLAGVFLNLLAQQWKFRIDLTEDRRYTLDPATLQLIRSLPETVTVTAYFTKELPPAMAVARQDFKDLLAEYAQRSGGKLAYEFLDPGASEELAARAVSEGIRPLLAQTRRKDRSENIQVLMGAVLRMGNKQTVIPALEAGPGMEWTLSSAIAQLTRTEKPLIGVVQGHREPSLRALDELTVQLGAQYDVEATAIYEAFPINERFTALLVIDPRDSIPPGQLLRIDEYMAKGHGVVLAYGAVQADLARTAEVGMRDIGIGPWLEGHGLRIGPNVVADERCGQVSVVQSTIGQPIAIPFPYYPLLNTFSRHPVAHGLDLVMFQFASPIMFTGDSGQLVFSPIISTSNHSALLAVPLTVDLRKQWAPPDFPDGPQTVGAAVAPMDTTLGRLVVFGNGNFCTGDQGGQQVALPKGNLDLMVNAADWVMRNTALLSIRGKQKEYRPIADPGEARRTALKWMNLLLPISVVLLYGLLRSQWRSSQRKRRMLPGHVR